MRPLVIALLAGSLLGCGKPVPPGLPAPGVPVPPATGVPEKQTLAQARESFATRTRDVPKGNAPARPPAGVFQLVKYDAPVGKLSAYLTPDPKDGRKRPAIVWITGGDCNSIDEGCWTDGGPANDQSAGAYRKAGVVMMFPSLRGGNDNPGRKEGFLGEVDDVIAAADFLAEQPHVDPARIYLGGHSTGGTVALLVAECTDKFRAVFSFGPVDEVAGYGPEYCPFDTSDATEVRLRSPGRYLHGVKVPTLVIEGATGNADSLRAMAKNSTNPNLTFVEVPGADHFGVLAPANALLAKKVAADTGPAGPPTVTAAEVIAAVRK